MKISSISLAAAVLPNAAWAQLRTTRRLRADLPAFEEDMSFAPASLSVQFMGHGNEHDGAKSGKGPDHGAKSEKSAKSGKGGKMSGKAGKSICYDEIPTLDLSQAYQPLQEMPQIYPDEDGVTRVQLQYNLAHYHGASFSTILRLYNGIAPGPTLHVKPGGSMELELVNCMANTTQVFGHNQYQHPNSTNMHTHGPHVSGMLPGDDVLVKINPEETHNYFYEFNGNHMPGTMWYHPHMHGSTSLQTGQGASGMLIIDEPEDYDIPAAIQKMPEVQIVFQHMDIGLLRESAEVSGDEVTNWIDHNFEITNTSTDLTNLMLVNMQFLPKITMEKDKWYRWRMMLSSIRSSVAFKSMSGNCEFKLLAKDGIFLNDAPRDVNTIMLSAGNRADVAVRCHEVGQEFMNTTEIPLWSIFGPFCPKPSDEPGSGNCGQYAQESDGPPVPDRVGTFADPAEQPTIMVIDVIPNEGDPDEDLAPFAAPTPCYLVDLTGLDESEIDGHFINEYACLNPGQDEITFGPPGWPVKSTPHDTCGVFGPIGIGGACKGLEPANCTKEALIPFDDEMYINSFATGTVQEILFIDATFHPYHQHINSFQITEIIPESPDVEIEPDVAQWYKVGDWQDTLQFPAVAKPGPANPGLTGPKAVNVKFRFQADLLNGRMIQHCHLLFHEDQGMMAQYNITGENGVVWAGAKLIDPMCVAAM